MILTFRSVSNPMDGGLSGVGGGGISPYAITTEDEEVLVTEDDETLVTEDEV